MKKTIALVLAAMMLMTLLLSGCGDSKESSKVSTGATTGEMCIRDRAKCLLSKRNIKNRVFITSNPL